MANWIDIAQTSELPEGGRLCITVEKKPLVVLNVAGQIYAIANTCPHAGRPLEEGEVRGLTITCPYHGYAYNLRNGKNLDYPDIEPPVPTYPTRIEDGKVHISFDRSTTKTD